MNHNLWSYHSIFYLSLINYYLFAEKQCTPFKCIDKIKPLGLHFDEIQMCTSCFGSNHWHFVYIYDSQWPIHIHIYLHMHYFYSHFSWNTEIMGKCLQYAVLSVNFVVFFGGICLTALTIFNINHLSWVFEHGSIIGLVNKVRQNISGEEEIPEFFLQMTFVDKSVVYSPLIIG